MWTLRLFEEPLIPLSSPLCLRFLLAFSLRRTRILAVSRYTLVKEPLVAFFDIFRRGFRGSWYWFSSSLIRVTLCHTPPVSGGCDEENLVKITGKSPPV